MRPGVGGLACALLMLVPMAVPAAGSAAGTVVAAAFAEPTTRYDHAILGDGIEYGALELVLADGRRRLIRLPESRVFEDLAPRLADLDGDGAPEVIVVETDLALGARLSVYDAAGLRAATPHIGQPYRWLAPVGAADLDGDGRVEIAFVDRPHLAMVLRVWRLEGGALREIASAPGLTNHRIGADVIEGGIAACGDRPAILTADAGWRQIVATRLDGGRLVSATLGRYAGPDSFARHLDCR
jgi:hypothetical protein